MAGVRIDKWLWAGRIFKTRSIATQACRAGRVTINGAPAKPSHTVDVGDKVGVRKPPVTFTFEVLTPASQRVGAAKVPEILRNITPRDQLEYLEITRIGRNAIRDRGTGRPTKKERREIDDYMLTSEFSGDMEGVVPFDSDDDGGDIDLAALGLDGDFDKERDE